MRSLKKHINYTNLLFELQVMPPKISILIPCYNAHQWIAQAIDSALQQTYVNKEVIVIDDGSTDNSLSVIQSFGTDIRWETSANNGGNAARNRLLEMSTGEWLQYLDADDYLLPNKIEKQVKCIYQMPYADILYGPSISEYYGTDGRIFQEIVPIPEPHDSWILLARWFLPQTGSPLWRKQAIIDVGGWRPDQPCCQEHELYLRLLIADKRFEYFSMAGSVYRQWSEQTVCKKDKPEVFRRRLEIENELEAYLHKSNLLTPERQYAINQARFECARTIWLNAPSWANTLIGQIHSRDRTFCPEGAAAPNLYRWVYRLIGFDAAEKIAMLRREIAGKGLFKKEASAQA